MDQQFLTPKQASKLYPLSLSLLYQLCDERRIPHFRIGGKGRRGKLLLAPRDIERFIEENRVEARSSS